MKIKNKHKSYKKINLIWKSGAVIVLLTLFIISAFLNFFNWQDNNLALQNITNSNFLLDVNESMNLIQKRVEVYADTLYSARGIFSAFDNVSRDKWDKYLKSQNITDRFPGIAIISYTERVNDSNLNKFINDVKTDESLTKGGYPAFKISPRGVGPDHFITKYVFPSQGNEKALGYDLTGEKSRNIAAIQARDSGLPTLTSPVQLVFDSVPQSAYAIIIPLYKNNTDTSTLESRRENHVGFIGLSFRVKPVIENIFSSNTSYPSLNFNIWDNSISDNYSVYKRFNNSSSNTNIQRVVELNVAGRKWIFQFSGDKNYKSSEAELIYPTKCFIIGTCINIIFLCLFIYYLFKVWSENKI